MNQWLSFNGREAVLSIAPREGVNEQRFPFVIHEGARLHLSIDGDGRAQPRP